MAELIKKLIKRDKKMNISAKPPVDIPTRKKLTVLGTISMDIIRLDAKKNLRREVNLSRGSFEK